MSIATDRIAKANGIGGRGGPLNALLGELVGGASLSEAAVALGIAEATARTHRNHIFTKTGVSRRTDLMLLVWRLAPPIFHHH
jgi:hypothetical protein